MKKGLFIAAFLIGLSCTVSAQEKKAPKDRLANLELTTQQRTSVDSVRKVYDKKRADVKKDAALSKEEQTAKIKELTKEQSTHINAILTPEQRKQLKAEKKKAQSH